MILLLPNEVLENIFQHLQLADRICLRRVCSRWQEVLEAMMKQQAKLGIMDSGRAACFAGAACHSMSEYDCIPSTIFKKMILCNSVPWFTDLMPNLKIISCNLRMTGQFVRRYSGRLECLQCDYIDDVAWKSDFPALIHVTARCLENVRFGRSCPAVQVIECWGSFAFRSIFSGLFPITRKQILTGTTSETLNNIAGSPAASSLQELTFHDYNEEARAFCLPNLRSLTMTGFRFNSDRSRKLLLTSIARSQQLTQLNLTCTGMLAAEWITMMSKLAQTLTSVTLKVQEEVVIFIASSIHQLQEITIYNGKLTDASVNALANMHHLQRISIVRPDVFEVASKITSQGILNLLNGNSRSCLQYLAIESRSVKSCPVLTSQLQRMEDEERLSSYRITDCKKLYLISDAMTIMCLRRGHNR